MHRFTLTSHQRSILQRSIAALSILSLMYFWFPPRMADATGTTTTNRIFLNRQQQGLTSGEQFQIFFTTQNGVSGGAGINKVKIQFPNDGADTGKWCATAGTGDLVVTGITDPTGATETATVVAGASMTAACTTTGGDLITISGLNNLNPTTKYGVQVAQKASSPSTLLGTGTNTSPTVTTFTITTNNGTSDVDSGSGYTTLISNDQLAVTATINPVITVTLSGNSAGLGTLDTGHVNQAGITSTVVTNAPTGYVSLVNYGATLTSGSFTIQDAPSTTLAIGAEGYGVSTSQSSQTITQWNPTSCATTTSTSNILKLQTAFQKFASSSSPANGSATGDQTTLCFMAGISTSTKPGSYTSTSTLVTTARF